MTVPSYTEDLTDLSTAESATGWVEMTGTDQNGNAYNEQGGPVGGDPDYPYIQGSYSVTQDCTKDTAVGSLCYNNGSGTGGHGTDGAYFVWQNFMVNSNVGTYAQGGFRIIVGSGLGDFNVWYVGGSDKGRYPYGGWQCNVVNTTITRDNWAGTHSGTEQYIGSGVYIVTGPGKGETHNADVIRYGRGSAIFEYGEAANYATIAGFAAQNDNSAYRWGLIQVVPGGYLWKGRLQLGSASNPVDFRDSNKIIFIEWTPKVTANFNTIDVLNAASNVEMTGFQFICLDTTTASRGRWITTNDATVVLTNCTFADMYTFVFDSNTTVDGCSFRRCNQITQGGADFDDCVFDESDAAVSFLVDNLNNVDNCDFVSDGTGHAMELTSAHAGNSYTLTGCTYTGYASSDGSTGNECIYNNSGGAVTITLDGGDTPTIMNEPGSTTTVVSGAVSVTVTAKTAAGVNVEDVRVLLRASSGTGPFPYDDTVTIVNSGTTATVDHTAHAMATTDKIQISGASHSANNGIFSITVSDVDTYTYTMLSTPGSSPTGTIKATFVALSGLTDGNGELTTSRVYSSDQPVSGHGRKSTGSPLYKSAPLVGDVDNADGFSGTAIMILDE